MSIREWFGNFLFHLNRWTGYPNQRIRFYKRHGYLLHLRNPRSFSEKVIWKKLYDRDPRLPIVADKLRVRDYLRTTLGSTRAEEHLIPLLYSTTDPSTIPFDRLPASYIVKTNHSSGWNIIVDGDHPADEARIVADCTTWLNTPYVPYKQEWAYRSITPTVVIEELLVDEVWGTPHDYKFFVFRGHCPLIQVDIERQNNHRRNMYDRDRTLLDHVVYRVRHGPELARPANLEAMLAFAEELGRDFDYVRVDLFALGDRIYFGELTHYPGSGMTRIRPRSFDFELGQHWQIQPLYWQTFVDNLGDLTPKIAKSMNGRKEK